MRRWLSGALIVGFSIFAALALCEAGLRLLGIEYPDFFDYDPVLGSRLRPGIKGYYLKEGRGWVSINSDGLRDREHPLKKPPHTLRIAVLGDSYTEAMQVNQEEAFWAVMEKELSGCGGLEGRRVEVLNFGQSGFGTAQELLAWRHRASKYAPDLVLLAFCTGNDVADNSPALMHFDYNPYFSFQDGRLVLNDRQTRERWAAEQKKRIWGWGFSRWLRDNLRVLQILQQGIKTAAAWWARKPAQAQAQGAPSQGEAGLSDTIYRPPASPVWQEAWKVTEALLVLLRDEVTAQGARLFLVVLSNGIQVHPDPVVRAGSAKRLGVSDLFYPDRRLAALGEKEGIPVLLLAPAFQEQATRRQVFFHGFKGNLGGGHWNQEGHRLAGKMLAEWLCGFLR